MKRLPLFSFFLLVFLGSSLCASGARPDAPGLEEYGVHDSSTITVKVLGGAIRHPGIYHLKPDVSFSELMKKAEWLRNTNGEFKVSRLIKGREVTLTISLDQPNFKLLDGDTVYARSIFEK